MDKRQQRMLSSMPVYNIHYFMSITLSCGLKKKNSFISGGSALWLAKKGFLEKTAAFSKYFFKGFSYKLEPLKMMYLA